tara:strand:+ start:332 stop:517 length:186 start_codon:yes stop_codon:yes gene_type:complete
MIRDHGVKKEVNLQDILYTISTWNVEANSSHNDGFTREHYLTKIFKVEEAINCIKKPKVVT